MVWPDYTFDDEKGHPLGSDRRADPNGFDQDLHRWYSKLIKLRNTHPILGTGMFEPIPTPDTSGILAFRRAAAGEQCVVVLNNTWITKRISIPIFHRQDGELTDLLSMKKFIVSNGSVTMSIEGKSGVVLQ
jgi:glycosidase